MRKLERSFLEVKIPTGAPFKRGDTVMRVGRIKPDQSTRAFIGNIVAIGILQEQDVRLHRNVHTATTKLETGRLMQTAGKYFALVGFAIMIMVLSFTLVGNGLRDALDSRE